MLAIFKRSFIILFVFSSSFTVSAQKVLRLNYSRFGIHHKSDFHRDDEFHYKAFGHFGYQTQRLLNFNDSIVFFDEEYGIAFSDIKIVKLYQHPYHNKLFQKVFLYAGIGYISLFAFNNWILNQEPILTEQAVWISVSLVAASYLVKQLGIKRIRLNNHNYLKVLDFDFEHLNSP